MGKEVHPLLTLSFFFFLFVQYEKKCDLIGSTVIVISWPCSKRWSGSFISLKVCWKVLFSPKKAFKNNSDAWSFDQVLKSRLCRKLLCLIKQNMILYKKSFLSYYNEKFWKFYITIFTWFSCVSRCKKRMKERRNIEPSAYSPTNLNLTIIFVDIAFLSHILLLILTRFYFLNVLFFAFSSHWF